MSLLYVDNAISWAQFRLRGGLKTILSVAGVYSLLVVGTILASYESCRTSHDKQDTLVIASTTLLGLQCIFLLLLGSMSIRRSIVIDLTTRQIESHRLMPLSPCQAIVGYIAGGIVQVLVLFIVTFVIGAILTVLGPFRGQVWLATHVLLLGFSIMVWAIAALTGFVSRGLFWLFFALFMSIIISGGAVFLISPALLMLCSPMLGDTMFQMNSTQGAIVTPALGISILAELIVAIICIRAAARRYANENNLAFTIPPAALIFMIWMALSWYGTANLLEIVGRRFLRGSEENMQTPAMIGSISTSLVMAMTLLSTAAWARIRDRQARNSKNDSAKSWMIHEACLALSVGGICLMTLAYPPQHLAKSWIAIPAICAICLVQADVLMRCFYGRLKSANLLIGFLTALIWAGPLLADVLYYYIVRPDSEVHLNLFAAVSPLGLLMQIYGDEPADIVWGLLWQAAFLVFAGLLLLRIKTAKRPQGLPTTVLPVPIPE